MGYLFFSLGQVWSHPVRRPTSPKTGTAVTTTWNRRAATRTRTSGSTWRWRRVTRTRWQRCDANWSAGVANWAKRSTPGGGRNNRAGKRDTATGRGGDKGDGGTVTNFASAVSTPHHRPVPKYSRPSRDEYWKNRRIYRFLSSFPPHDKKNHLN